MAAVWAAFLLMVTIPLITTIITFFSIRDFSSGNIVKQLNGSVGSGGNLNNHKFSRHSDDWVMYTRTGGCNGCPDQIETWQVKWRDSQGYKLGDWLKAFDYHPTAVYGPAEPPEATSLDIAPSKLTLELGKSDEVEATLLDQFGNPMPTQPAIAWTVTGAENSIDNGVVTAGTEEGSFTITASAGGFEATVPLSIVSFMPVDIKINGCRLDFTHLS